MQPTLYTALARKLPKPLYRWLAKRWIDYNFPRHLYIELNTSCNLSCWHCPRPSINKEIDYEVFKKVIDEASLYGKRSFSLHLFGEPLLYSRILEAILYIKSKGHTVLLTTNGTFLDEFAERLMAAKVDRIIWTWGRNKLLPSTIRKIKRVLLVRVFDGTPIKEENKKALKGCQFEYKKFNNMGGSLDVPQPTIPRYPCYHLWLAPAVRYNGDFTLCCNDYAGSLSVGNVMDHSIHDLWNSEAVWKRRNEDLSMTQTDICTNCTAWAGYPRIL